MKTTHIQEDFLRVYDLFVQDIFNYFLSRTLERNAAKRLTKEAFVRTWNNVSQSKNNEDLDIQNILKQQTTELTESYNGALRYQMAA